MNNYFLSVSSSPHIRSPRTTRSLMADVLIALAPAMVMAIVYYRFYALTKILVCVAVAVAAEYIWNFLMKREQTAGDLSAAVTGALIALNLSPLTPFWIGALGSVFAIIIVKMLFGGIGHNFLNPALAARAFLMASWPVQMTNFLSTGQDAVTLSPAAADAFSSATLMQAMRIDPDVHVNLQALFFGHTGGCLGETSAMAILIGAVYLIVRRVIHWEIPSIYVLGTGILCTAFSPNGFFQGNFLYQVLGGGLLLGACFMANDYTTSPMTRRGKIIYALACAFMTFVIRRFGGYPEGVSYSILIMNLFVPLIDRWTVPKVFGEEAKHVTKS